MFENLDKDLFVAGLLKRKVGQLLRRPGFHAHERDDLRQELLLRLFRGLPAFDPARGSWHRFVKTLLERAAATLVRERRQPRRRVEGLASLAEPLRVDGEETDLGSQVRERENDNRRGLDRRERAEQRQLELDMARELSLLSAPLKELAGRLMWQSITAAARETGIPRTTLQSRARKLLQVFEKADLQDYLRSPSSGRKRSG